jgi:hypothetical protein
MDNKQSSSKRLIGIGFIVYLVATILMAIFYTVGILYGAFKSLYNRQFISGIADFDNKLFTMAVMKDQTGNVVCAELFNLILIKKISVNKFGKEDETISSVLGRNELSGTLSPIGEWLAKTLNSIQHNHCINSIGK